MASPERACAGLRSMLLGNGTSLCSLQGRDCVLLKLPGEHASNQPPTPPPALVCSASWLLRGISVASLEGILPQAHYPSAAGTSRMHVLQNSQSNAALLNPLCWAVAKNHNKALNVQVNFIENMRKVL